MHIRCATPQAFERARASAAAELRKGARVVWLTSPAEPPPGRLLCASVADAAGCLVDGRVAELGELASRILAALGAPDFTAATGAVRALAAHLRSRGRRLVVGITHPEELPGPTLRELGRLLRESGGGLALLVESRGDDLELWAALGVEPTRVRVHEALPSPAATAPTRPRRRLPLALAAGAGVAAVAALTGILLVEREPGRDARAEAPAPRAAVAPRAAHAAPRVEPQAAPPESEAERAPPLPLASAAARREESDAVQSGRRALAALADARSDAEWEEGTRILRDIGPQPALLHALDELGARPGCVRKRGCVSTRARLEAALCEAWADAIERGEAPSDLDCS